MSAAEKNVKDITPQEMLQRKAFMMEALLGGVVYSMQQFTLLDVLAGGKPQYTGADVIEFLKALLGDAADSTAAEFGKIVYDDEPKAE